MKSYALLGPPLEWISFHLLPSQLFRAVGSSRFQLHFVECFSFLWVVLNDSKPKTGAVTVAVPSGRRGRF